jgi:aryl-alcohol dehydrogenase-like predicted oxidoreductase
MSRLIYSKVWLHLEVKKMTWTLISQLLRPFDYRENAYNITFRRQESVLDLCKTEHIAWVPYFPLGGGIPSMAKVTSDSTVQEVAKEMGISPAQVGLAWLLRHSENTLIIPGTTSISHLEENIAVGNIRFDENTMKRLDAVKAAKGLGAVLSGFMN